MTKSWMNLEQTATHLGVTPYDVQGWIETQELPVHEVANAWRFDLAEVNAWIDRAILRAVAKRCPSCA